MNKNQNEVVRAHVWVQGRVQGVGFRAHVDYCARLLGLRGWTRNVGADEVEAVAEGRREAIENFIESVKQGPRASRVDDSRVEWEEVTGEFAEFEVRRSV